MYQPGQFQDPFGFSAMTHPYLLVLSHLQHTNHHTEQSKTIVHLSFKAPFQQQRHRDAIMFRLEWSDSPNC